VAWGFTTDVHKLNYSFDDIFFSHLIYLFITFMIAVRSENKMCHVTISHEYYVKC